MRFYEFEAKALLEQAGVPVAKGGTATTADELDGSNSVRY